MSQTIAEAATLTATGPATGPVAGTRWRARIIEGNIWGSSGYYSAELLERDGPSTWPEGTQIFLDHPGDFEAHDRPERSLRDLAGRIASTPVYEGDGLYADVEFYTWVAPIVLEMAGDIGLSIRAAATGKYGERDGGTGLIFDRLFNGESVDLVTKPGAGGRLVSLLESARPRDPEGIAISETTTPILAAPEEGDMTTTASASAWALFEALRGPDPDDVVASAVAHGVSEATANDTRDALTRNLRAAYGGQGSWVFVRDFDETNVWYEHESEAGSVTWQQPYSIGADLTVTLGEERTQVRPVSAFVEVADQQSDATEAADPETPADAATEAATDAAESTTTQEPADAGEAPTDPVTPVTDAAEAADPSQEDTMSNTQGAGGAAPTSPRQVMEARLAEQDRQIATMRATQQATPIIAEVLASGWISEAQRARITAQVMGNLPLTDELALDEAALRTRATEALEAAETEGAEILSAAGYGTPRGLSALTTPATEAAKAQTSADLAESLKVFGLSDAATDIAVKGR